MKAMIAPVVTGIVERAALLGEGARLGGDLLGRRRLFGACDRGSDGERGCEGEGADPHR
ncbi:MAG: hypothetical protein IPQ07_20940 [Myxococcales bacterium]|nr:hypothetical protein [Myxococcales bacterium]